MALGQLGAFLVEDHRHVAEPRQRRAERLVDVDLAGCVVDVVVAADHLGDLHVPVVDHHGEVVGGPAVRTEDHEVVQLGVGDLDPALDQVVEHHHAVERILEADDAVGIVAVRQVEVARGAVVARLLLVRQRRLAHGFQFLARLVGVVGRAIGDHLFGDFAVAVQALGLVDRALVVVQLHPVHRLEDGVDRAWVLRSRSVSSMRRTNVPPLVARLQPAVQRGARATDVEVTGGAGSKSASARHGTAPAAGVGRRFYRSPSPAAGRGGALPGPTIPG